MIDRVVLSAGEAAAVAYLAQREGAPITVYWDSSVEYVIAGFGNGDHRRYIEISEIGGIREYTGLFDPESNPQVEGEG